MQFDIENWVHQFWVTKQRYYIIQVEQDLFGTWVGRRTWGSRTSNHGQSMTVALPNYAAAIDWLNQMTKRRKQRGYEYAT